MYTLSIISGMEFEFQEMDMPLIRKWWCLLLMERFKIEGHGQRFAFWTDEARKLLQGTLQPVYRVARQHQSTCRLSLTALQMKRDWWTSLCNQRELSSVCRVCSTGSLQSGFLLSPLPRCLSTSTVKSLLHRTPTQLSFTDEVQFIFGVLFPEAIIYGLAVLKNLSWQQAKQVFLCGPVHHHSEVEEFNRLTDKQQKKEGRPFNW
ncbi:uncharacterized protein LOC118804444 [Colossoma macropomum]|uniref:uncharacterized protein LOC118804444 n=1 Tax=Colossoma macropomum TaxID=42526 RepID=UPI001863CC45|nr:uncharacterized protein LOC118804444 [Colossoma macropomum]